MMKFLKQLLHDFYISLPWTASHSLAVDQDIIDAEADPATAQLNRIKKRRKHETIRKK